MASSDVLNLGLGKYIIHEFLDLYNDHNYITVEVRGISADTWNGHRAIAKGENWFNRKENIQVEPGETARIAEREQIVEGVPHMNWWIRWVRFTAYTDKGIFQSNFVSTPYKRPGRQTTILPLEKFDSLSSPGKRVIPKKTDDY